MTTSSDIKRDRIYGQVSGRGSQVGEQYAAWYYFDGAMSSFDNPGYPDLIGRGLDIGSPWYCTKSYDRRSILAVPRNYRYHTSIGGYYNGTCALGAAAYGQPSRPTAMSSTQLDAAGTTAIAKTEPTSAIWSGATFLGELREGVPSWIGTDLLKDRTNLARAAGKEYLNYEFGWKPLVNDVKKFFHTVVESDRIVRDYITHSDTSIHRRYVNNDQNVYSTWSGTAFFVPNITALGTLSGFAETNVINKTWFSGSFKYSIPESQATSEIGRAALLARKGLGAELTPEVVWNLSPWSWAADWFGNMGDVMSAVSALGRDGLRMEYGYAMNHTEVKTSVRASHRDLGWFTRIFGSAVKQRRPATPFGFGVSWESLSARQLAIITALGTSRW